MCDPIGKHPSQSESNMQFQHGAVVRRLSFANLWHFERPCYELVSIKAWFPTFIYYEQLSAKGGEKFNRELLKECYQIRDYDEGGRAWSEKNYPGGYTSYGSM